MDSSNPLEAYIKDLVVSYEQGFALTCPILTLRGHIMAVLGHNGAGKSTFIKTTLGLLEPQRGSLQFRFHDKGEVTVLSPERDMAFCPENGAVFADISVENYLKLWCRIRHRDARYYMTKGSRFLEQLQITPLLGMLGRELSKGQRRRVQTAIGFLLQPKLFLFDEPFDGLDVQRSSELADLIAQESKNMCVVLSSHRMDVVERLADSVMVLREGQFVAAGPTVEVAETLAGNSLRIRSLPNAEEVVDTLRDAISSLVVNHIGSDVIITGEGDLSAAVSAFTSLDGADIETVRPSLTDAINYHLKQVRRH